MAAAVTALETPKHAPHRAALLAHRARDRRNRWSVVGLAAGGALLFGASYFLPWWNFNLVAPQYPQGLDVQIALSGVTGAVDEIDILNHYIGMQSLSAAAAAERAASWWLVTAGAVAIAAGLIMAGRKLAWLALLPAIGLPLGFVIDTSWWMYRFGHELDPKAPIDFPTFTPVLLGPGMIGQFHTWAWPAMGFWAAVAGLAAVIGAEVMRRKVCNDCELADSCGVVCPRAMVLPAPKAGS